MQGLVITGLVVLMSVIWLSGPGLAAAESPTEFLRRTTESILQVFENPDLQGSARREVRLTRLQHIADTAFDWPEIARRVLATHWQERTPEERQEFTVRFREAMQGMYLERLESGAHEQLRDKPAIQYGEEQLNGARAVVRTTIL